MKTRTRFLGWSALFILVAVLFVPSVIAHRAHATEAVAVACPAPMSM